MAASSEGQLVAQILEYWNDVQDVRNTNWDHHWQEISEWSLGRRDFVTIRQPGQERYNRITDTTSQDSHRMLVAVLQALLTNTQTDWFDVRFERAELNDDEEFAAYVEAVKERMQLAFSRPQGGFATQITEDYSDLTGFGTGAIFMGEDEETRRGIRFEAIPLPQLYIDTTASGRVEVVFRRYELAAWKAVDKWGEEALPEIAKIAKKHPSRKFEFIHHVRRNRFPLPGQNEGGKKEWQAFTISLHDKTLVKAVEGFDTMPYIVARWNVDAGETYGRGPGIFTLPNQRMLNAIWLTFIRSAEKAVDPPVIVPNDSVMPGHDVRVTPSAQIVVQNDEGGTGTGIRYLESRAQFIPSKEVIEDRQTKIEDAWHANLIKIFQQPLQTATQVLELARLSQRVLSPVMGRLEVELLNPMIERAFDILSKQSDFPVAPQAIEGEELKIEYVSPIARAQKAEDAQAIMETFNAAAAMFEADSSIMDNLNLDESIRAIHQANGAPGRTLNSLRVVAATRQQRAEQQAEDAQRQQLLEAAKVAPGVIDSLSQAGAQVQ